MKAVPANAAYVRSPQKAVGSPSSVAHRLESTRSHPLPSVQPCTDAPARLVHDRYAVSRMPSTLSASSGRFGVGLVRYDGGSAARGERLAVAFRPMAGSVSRPAGGFNPQLTCVESATGSNGSALC